MFIELMNILVAILYATLTIAVIVYVIFIFV